MWALCGHSLFQTLIFELHVAWFAVKNGPQKDICHNEDPLWVEI